MDLVAGIDVKVTQVFLPSLPVNDKNKGQQNMKAGTVYTKISKSLHPFHSASPPTNICICQNITFLAENITYKISKHK